MPRTSCGALYTIGWLCPTFGPWSTQLALHAAEAIQLQSAISASWLGLLYAC